MSKMRRLLLEDRPWRRWRCNQQQHRHRHHHRHRTSRRNNNARAAQFLARVKTTTCLLLICILPTLPTPTDASPLECGKILTCRGPIPDTVPINSIPSPRNIPSGPKRAAYGSSPTWRTSPTAGPNPTPRTPPRAASLIGGMPTSPFATSPSPTPGCTFMRSTCTCPRPNPARTAGCPTSPTAPRSTTEMP